MITILIALLIVVLLLTLIAKYVPHGDVIVAIVVCAYLLKFFGLLPMTIVL